MDAGYMKNNAGVMPEGVMDGTPEITEDNLFELVDSGALTMEQANEWIKAQEEAVSGGDYAVGDEKGISPENNLPSEEGAEPIAGGESLDNGKPFRVYNSQEDFQRDFNKSWNKRYAKDMAEREAKDAEHDELLTSLGALLGVPKEQAKDELLKRQRKLEAEKKNVDPDEYIARRSAEDERDKLRRQLDEEARAREGAALVADIRSQGDAISSFDRSFNIDKAMENPEFKKAVFTLYRAFPGKAVEMAYNTIYGRSSASQVARPSEGAASNVVSGDRRPVDFSNMSSKDILAMEKEIMKGKKIDLK